MNKKIILGGILTVGLTVLMFIVGFNKNISGTPVEVYQVYLDGKKMGLIASKNELLDLIDKEQISIKKEYGVDKVYPPNGLDVEKIYTYDTELSNVNDIYNNIKDSDNFTIDGYDVTITYNEDKVINDGETIKAEDREAKHIYILDRSILEPALYNTAAAFIGTENLKNFENKTQAEIVDVGEKITSVYFAETITVKKSLISTDEVILNTVEELSQYLLYGTINQHNTYTISEGENLQSIADKNSLNIEELLIANPNYKTKDVLLTAGAKVNVDLIDPLLDVTYRKEAVSDVEVAYKQDIVKDNNKYVDYSEVTTKGENGLTRVTQDIKYVNGVIQDLKIIKSDVLKAPVNEVVTKGTKKIQSYVEWTPTYSGDGNYAWPTLSPFVITSRFEYRWGSFHRGVDISGTGYGSPILSIADGVVYKTGFGSNEGNYIIVKHSDTLYSQYMHLAKIQCSAGQHVGKGQRIGSMGSTGFSTGTHLHLGIWLNAPPYQEGSSVVDPCRSVFRC